MPRPESKTKTKRNISTEVQEARNTLRIRGWSQVDAAQFLGISRVHLTFVLNGRRTSKLVLAAIATIPTNPIPA